ncbi:MAG: hypothetical protein QM705_01250 [Ancrocorticia sp.]
MTTRTKIAAVLVTAALAVSLSSCSSNDDGAAPGTANLTAHPEAFEDAK